MHGPRELIPLPAAWYCGAGGRQEVPHCLRVGLTGDPHAPAHEILKLAAVTHVSSLSPAMLTRVLITVYSRTMNEAIQREHIALVLGRRFRTRAATGLESGGRLSASKTL